MRFQRTISSIVALPFLALSLFACGGNQGQEDIPVAAETAESAPDLSGTWKQVEADTDYHQASIEDGSITINWVSEEDKSRSLYWAGSFQAPDSAGPYTWNSKGNMKEMESALLASTSASKTFTYDDDLITYEVSALGTTTTMQLEKLD
ncbi:hypothetical protein [Kocuria sp.]|uniref:hypothetical protein n=1 Tax=Kocuria sp. TaxID=1871328 RepID=UPI0026E049F9|nr:hypothetical protein [Kocuria sp.]MDO5368387.1 hypothetical protein [Kocuria sp.]